MSAAAAPLRRWAVLLAALVGVALTGRLGVWQLDRADQKASLQALLDARSSLPPLDATVLARTPVEAELQHYRSVVLQGRWDAHHTVFLDNRPMGGRPGFLVVTPLLLSSPADAVLVQRGWVPRDATDRTRLPPVSTPDGPVTVRGLIAPPPARLFAFGADAPGPIRQNLELDAMARETGLVLRALSVLQVDTAEAGPDGLARQWSRPAVDVHKNYGYAFQWFSLAALMTGLYVWFQLVRPRLRRDA
jgi:surfeit locus 1 family protein